LELKTKLNATIEIIKVFSADENFDFGILKPFEKACDYFLFDTKGKLPGGNGTTFDWKVLSNYPSTKPFFLSGGIGIEEIAAVKEISKTNLPLYAIDVNSKFEIEPGLKNIERLKDLKIENSSFKK
jgi:phosphoribosylanthranilate isomerase